MELVERVERRVLANVRKADLLVVVVFARLVRRSVAEGVAVVERLVEVDVVDDRSTHRRAIGELTVLVLSLEHRIVLLRGDELSAHGPALNRLDELVRPEVLGIGASQVMGLSHSLCESLFENGDVALSTRWGRLPPLATTDPTTLDPIDEPSWVLDLDMFRAVQQKDFDADAVLRDGRSFARSIHDFFRWCVTPELLRIHGGKT